MITTGAVTFGMGDKLVKTSPGNKTLKAGGYFLATANMNHFAFTGAEGATIVLYGLGPVQVRDHGRRPATCHEIGADELG